MNTGKTEKTILLVEDEGLVLLALQMALQEFDYRVFTATNGLEALQEFAQHKEEIDLVITDMSMPGMDGMDLLITLRAESPNLKVILMTGHLLDTSKLSLQEQRPTRRVAKPISLEMLIEIVEEMLA